ncbi:MAG TPA: hypothetical protein VFA05_04295 [Gaiellaceae bacterium]|nr:hypothetical protein [Gaiellaceae bacterium]
MGHLEEDHTGIVVTALCREVARLQGGLEEAGRALDELGRIVDTHRGDEEWHGELQRKIEEAWRVIDRLVTPRSHRTPAPGKDEQS